MSIDVPEDLRTEPVITVTDDALAQILELKAKENDGDELCLRIEVVGTQGVDYLYDLAFATLDEATEGDSVATARRPAGDRARRHRRQADGRHPRPAQRRPGRPGPPQPQPAQPAGRRGHRAHGHDRREDPPAPRAVDQPGPRLPRRLRRAGAHRGDRGGGIRAVVTMGGGCQGCAVSAITLREGIEAAIKEAIPEVTEIVDGTDHDAGENPYFT